MLDKLSKDYSFEVPKTMLENENKVIWDRFEQDRKAGVIDEIDKGEKVVIIDKGKVLDSGDVEKIVKKTKTKNIREAFNKMVGIKS